jgi:purine-cytosine permease-like protein
VFTRFFTRRIRSWAGILILAVLTTLVSIYGYRYVHRYERYAWIPMAILFAIMLIVGLVATPHLNVVATRIRLRQQKLPPCSLLVVPSTVSPPGGVPMLPITTSTSLRIRDPVACSG